MPQQRAARPALSPAPFHLTVQVASERPCPSRQQLRRWVARGLRAALPVSEKSGLPKSIALVLRFVDEAEGRALNSSFRQKDYATNVLTFRYDEADALVADVVVCAPVVEREAAEQGKLLKDRYAHLVIHATLHACGYDHEKPDDAARMEALETSILAGFRIADPYA